MISAKNANRISTFFRYFGYFLIVSSAHAALRGYGAREIWSWPGAFAIAVFSGVCITEGYVKP